MKFDHMFATFAAIPLPPGTAPAIFRETAIYKQKKYGSACILIFASALLAGCVSSGGTKSTTAARGGVEQNLQGQELSYSERELRERSERFNRTVWEGALIGAAGGALWGVLAGDDVKGMLQKAAIGGVVGGLAGSYVANKKQQYVDREDQLESMILDVRESNEEMEELISSLRAVIAENKRQMASIEQRYRKGLASEEDVRRSRARLSSNQQVAEEAATGAKEKQTMFNDAKEAYADLNLQRLNRELEAYNSNMETLDDLILTISKA